MKTKKCIVCKKCNQVFKYRNAKYNLKEHFNNYHAKPKFNKDGTIQLNAVHQITLIIKRGKMWKTILRDRQKNNDQSGINICKTITKIRGRK